MATLLQGKIHVVSPPTSVPGLLIWLFACKCAKEKLFSVLASYYFLFEETNTSNTQSLNFNYGQEGHASTLSSRLAPYSNISITVTQKMSIQQAIT